MARGAAYIVKYRREREKKTNYRKRMAMLKSGAPRLVVRKSNKNMAVQVINYSENGDVVMAMANSSELKKFGWNHSTSNIPAAYLTGLLCGKKALSGKIENAIVDLGMQSLVKGSRIYAAVKGAKDSGLNVRVDDEVFPADDRIAGKHISSHIGKSKNIAEDLQKVKDSIIKK